MVAQKPILVFVPGGWHTPDCYTPTTSLLQDHGYTTEGVSLPSIGSELQGIATPRGWEADVESIRSVLLKHINAGSDVVLIVHSYSGTVGSEACQGLSKTEIEAQGLSGGVIKLVYLAALIHDVGQYIWERSGGEPINTATTTVIGEVCHVNKNAAANWFYNECSPEEQRSLTERLRSHAWTCFMTPVTYTAWRDVPSVYLMTEKDNAIPLAYQELQLSEANGHRFEVVRCDADHSPFVSRPQLTATVIRRAAGEEIDV